MAKLWFRIGDEFADAIDAAAAKAGQSRSAFICNALEKVVEIEERKPVPPREHKRRFHVSLTMAVYQAAATEADRASMKLSEWTATLVRRWLAEDGRPTIADSGEMNRIRSLLKSIGTNINQIAHAGNQIAMHNVSPANTPDFMAQLDRLPSMIAEISKLVEELRELRARDALYWLTSDRLAALSKRRESDVDTKKGISNVS